MKKLVFTTLILSLIMTVYQVNAQTPAHDEVAKTTKKLIDGMLKADGTILSALVSEQLSYGHSSGKIESKAQFVKTIVSGESVFESINTVDQTIQVVDNTAIVRHIFEAKTNDPGKGPANIRIGIVLTWVKQKNAWLLLARQAFKLP